MSTYYTHPTPGLADSELGLSSGKRGLDSERDPLVPPLPGNYRNVVVVHESPSREICLSIIYGCCIFWILFILIILILVIVYYSGGFDDDY